MLNKIYTLKENISQSPKYIDLITTNFSLFYNHDSNFLCSLVKKYFDNRVYEPDSKGLISARNTILKHIQRYTVFDNLNSDSIYITPSTSESYAHIFKSVLKEGESVLLPKPTYPLFSDLANFTNTQTLNYTLKDNTWGYDLSDIEKGLQKGSKLIVLISPNNPTGSVIHKEEFMSIVELAVKYRANILIDEVFQSYTYEENINWDFNFLNEDKYIDLIIFKLNGISKLLALPDLKLAWIEIYLNKNNKYKEQLNEKLELSIDTFLNTNSLIQSILPEILNINVSIDILNLLKQNRDYLIQLPKSSHYEIYIPNGGIHFVIKLNVKKSEEDFVIDLLSKKEIFVHPGYFYDFVGSNKYIVLSLLNTSTLFKSGINNLIQHINNYG